MAEAPKVRDRWTARLWRTPQLLLVACVFGIVFIWFPISLYRQSKWSILPLYLEFLIAAGLYSWLFVLGLRVPFWRRIFIAAFTGGLFVLVWFVIAPANRLLDSLIALPSLLIAMLGVPRARRRLLSWRQREQTAPLTNGDAAWVSIGFLAVSWILLTIGDRVVGQGSTWQRIAPTVVRAEASPWPNARVGIALSGGGYRAALFHAGVLSALDELGVHIRVMSTVSGGSIIGAFYARGGSPAAFVDAVAQGHFNLKRNMLHAHNALHLIASARVPLLSMLGKPHTFLLNDGFSRTHIQAQLLDRLLFDGVVHHGNRVEGRPELMVNTTDLVERVMVGVTPDGVVYQDLSQPLERIGFSSPVRWKMGRSPAPAYVTNDAFDLPGDHRLSSLVAASGAFPGAFNAYSVDVSIGAAADLRAQVGFRNDDFLLVDGGVADNYGIVLLSAARRLARGFQEPNWPFAPKVVPPEPALSTWDVDAVIVSDGSAYTGSVAPHSTLDEVGSAIDLMYSLSAGPGMFADREELDDSRASLILVSPRTLTSVPTIYRIDTQDYLDFGYLDAATNKTKKDTFYLPSVTLVDMERSTFDYVISQMPPENRARAQELVKLLVSEGKMTADGWAGPLTPHGDPPSPERKLWRLVSDEIGERMRAFVRTSTLDDQIDRETAYSIYLLGRYQTFFNKAYLLCQLERSNRARMARDSTTWAPLRDCRLR